MKTETCCDSQGERLLGASLSVLIYNYKESEAVVKLQSELIDLIARESICTELEREKIPSRDVVI